MRFILQVVDHASVYVKEKEYRAEIGQWLLIYVGIHKDDVSDYQQKIAHFVGKIRGLQLFHVDGKLQGSLDSVWWEILLISNFTLYWENKKGNRFDFGNSAWFAVAELIYNTLVEQLRLPVKFSTDENILSEISVKTGLFGEFMEVDSRNGWPINLILDI